MFKTVVEAFVRLFGSKKEADIKKLRPILEQIKSFESAVASLTDEQLKEKTQEFKRVIRENLAPIETEELELKEKIEQDDSEGGLPYSERLEIQQKLDGLKKEWKEELEATLNELLPEAYAVLKETCKRFVGKSWVVTGHPLTWNMVPYDVQLLGAIVMHQGKISEMKTGEGKTLVAIFPAYLNAIAGRGVHIVTVNDYLSKRDSEWNAPIFGFHGLTVDCVDRYEPNSDQRRNAYLADITYGTNNEFGFDYLRDNMAPGMDQVVQRGHHFAIVDEVDSVLIDEARTPLIISGPVPNDNQSQKFVDLKPRIAALVEAQKKLVAALVGEFEDKLAAGKDEEAGLALLRAQRGFPKNKKLEKLLQESATQRILQKTEYFYLQDNAKNMPVVDDELYYSIDHKHHSIEMSDRGRAFITGKDEDPDFFVIPDMGLETSRIEDDLIAAEKLAEAELRDLDYSAEYKEDVLKRKREDLRKEKVRRLNELNRLFAERSERIHSVNQLLRAYTLFERDTEYIVQEGKVLIVDEHTGRVLSGRRYSDGLHQAIEAKENVRVEAATQTYATITLQNYFRLYHKLAGMTGTAITEEGEFYEIYKLEVTEVPTNRPVSRKDNDDMIYRTKREKYNATIAKIKEYHEKGQPVLVGTTSVEVSETVSRMLQRAGIKHNVLNAKQHQRESEIVAEAGIRGAVTIATNMAGRGTDIKLGEGVIALGGLAIVGTERHESRRIDLQLRGRSGRQGDPGESQFFVSMEDHLMRYFASDRVVSMMERLKFEEGEVIQHPWFTKALERAQKRVEQNNFGIRKRQLEYDDVLNNQRKVIYGRRNHALQGERLADDITEMLTDLVADLVESQSKGGNLAGLGDELLRILAVDIPVEKPEWSSLSQDDLIDRIVEEARASYREKEKVLCEPFFKALKNLDLQLTESSQHKPTNIQLVFTDGIRRMRVVVNFAKALSSEGRELFRALERSAVLSIIDDKWMEHLRDLDSLKEGIGLRAFGQKDPLLEYKREAFHMFKQLLVDVNREVIALVWKAVPETDANDPRLRQEAEVRRRGNVDLTRAKARHEAAPTLSERVSAPQNGPAASESEPQEKKMPVVVGEKIGRNDPCPCGSGKKYKQCHGKPG